MKKKIYKISDISSSFLRRIFLIPFILGQILYNTIVFLMAQLNLKVDMHKDMKGHTNDERTLNEKKLRKIKADINESKHKSRDC